MPLQPPRRLPLNLPAALINAANVSLFSFAPNRATPDPAAPALPRFASMTNLITKFIAAAAPCFVTSVVLAQAATNALATTTTNSTTHLHAPPRLWSPTGDRQIIIPNLTRRSVIGRPGLEAVELSAVNAQVSIVDQVATTVLELTLWNPASTPQESVMVLPVPDGVIVRAVQYDGTGPEPVANILPKDQARAIYTDIVRAMKDPALVEFVGLNLLQTSVFPIPPRTKQTLRLTLEQVLAADGGRVDYTLVRSNSLHTSSPGTRATPWTMTVDVKSKLPIATIYSPSHQAAVRVLSPNHASITFSGPGSHSGSLRLTYLTARTDTATPTFTVFACPAPAADNKPGANAVSTAGSRGGYFMAMGVLPQRREQHVRKREVTLVIDRSGSMRGGKFDQAKAAATAVIEGLADGEAMNVIDYSDTIRSYSPQPVIKSAQSSASIKEYIASLSPVGGTNIDGALQEALRAQPTANTLPLVLFLTDGLATIGERNEARIRRSALAANTSGRRIFSFGIGYDVNTPLLAGLSQATRATSTFVTPEEDLEVSVSRVFRGLAGPILELPSLAPLSPADRARLPDIQPATLPDYYDGDQVILLGQYTGDAPLTLTLMGTLAGVQSSIPITIDPAHASMQHDYVPRLWARHRIASLIEALRQAGADAPIEGPAQATPPGMKEITDEIVRLSTEFGILTEYTAFLATQQAPVGATAAPAMRAQAAQTLTRRAVSTRSGAGAVNQERNLQALKDAGTTSRPLTPAPPGSPAPQAAAMPAQNNAAQSWLGEDMKKVEISTVRQLGANTFYQRNNQWVDARALASADQPAHQTITANSDAYFDLAIRLAAKNQQHLLAQEGNLLLWVDGQRILVTVE